MEVLVLATAWQHKVPAARRGGPNELRHGGAVVGTRQRQCESHGCGAHRGRDELGGLRRRPMSRRMRRSVSSATSLAPCALRLSPAAARAWQRGHGRKRSLAGAAGCRRGACVLAWVRRLRRLVPLGWWHGRRGCRGGHSRGGGRVSLRSAREACGLVCAHSVCHYRCTAPTCTQTCTQQRQRRHTGTASPNHTAPAGQGHFPQKGKTKQRNRDTTQAEHRRTDFAREGQHFGLRRHRRRGPIASRSCLLLRRGHAAVRRSRNFRIGTEAGRLRDVCGGPRHPQRPDSGRLRACVRVRVRGC